MSHLLEELQRPIMINALKPQRRRGQQAPADHRHVLQVPADPLGTSGRPALGDKDGNQVRWGCREFVRNRLWTRTGVGATGTA